MKKIFIIILTLSAITKATAQDDMQSSQLFANKLYYNPAATGYSDKFFVSGAYRMQWAGTSTSLPKAARPRYILMNATQYFHQKRSGLGLSIYDGRQNVEKSFLAKVAYAYHMQVQEQAWLSMGTSVGLLSKTVDGSITPDEQSADFKMAMMSDWSLGVEYYTPELCVGVAAQHIPLVLGDNENRFHTHFYYYMTYYHQLDEDWRLMPSIALRNSAFITNFELLLRASYLNMFQLGVGYRLDAFPIIIGVNLGDSFALSYSIDLNNKYLRNRSRKASHEIMLSYRTQIIKRYNTLQRLEEQKDF